MQRGISAEQWAAIRALREDAVPTFPLLAEATGFNVSTIRERAAREGWRKQPFQSAVQRKARETILERCRQDACSVLAWAEGRMTVLALLAAAEQEWPGDAGSGAGGRQDGVGRGSAGDGREDTGPASTDAAAGDGGWHDGAGGRAARETGKGGGAGNGPADVAGRNGTSGLDGARGAGRNGGGARAAGWHAADRSEAGFFATNDGALLAEKLERLGRLLARQVDAIIETAEFAGARLDRPGLDEIAALLRLSEKALALSGPARAAEDGQETRSDEELAAMLALLDERVVELARLHAEWLVGEKDRQGG